MSDILLVGGGRVWVIRFRAGPDHTPEYLTYGAAGAPDWGQGDVTKIEIPSETAYNQWEEVGTFQSSADRATLSITMYLTDVRSVVMDLLRTRCPFDVQIHMGDCEDPRDFNHGWVKVRVFEDARLTGYSATEHGALEGGSQEKITEEMPISAKWIYDILRMKFKEVAASYVSEVIVAVDVVDTITCGNCGDPSDGCQKVIALSDPKASSPGVKPQLIFTSDGYTTADETWVTTMAIGEEASDGEQVGVNYVVVSSDGIALHYAPIADILDGTETWTKVTTGFVAAHGPNCIWNYAPLFTFMGGDGGYIYFTEDPTDAVTVLDAGVITTEDLNDISGWNATNVTAVGDAKAIVYTIDGTIFALMTPPAAGPTNLYAVAYRRENEIWVGGDIVGSVYVTDDYGAHWTTKNLPGNGTRVDKIVWASDTVGFIAIRTSSPAGKILRTIDGGHSWYVMPESSGQAIPANDYIKDIDVCPKEVNVLYAGGLGDGAADGILLKGND